MQRKIFVFALAALLICSTLTCAEETDLPVTNLLQNSGFEQGDEGLAGWGVFPRTTRGVQYVWEQGKSYSGRRSACVAGMGRGFGMWQQIVEVQAGSVYMLEGYVAFENIPQRGRCCLQIVFRDRQNRMLDIISWPSHRGTREFALDYPAHLKVRAPADAARAEVNLFLQGRGRAWFDDIVFGPVDTGAISGKVSCDGKPVEGATVFIYGDPWGKRYEDVTDENGEYELADVPVANSRYILLARKAGLMTRPIGDIGVTADDDTKADFAMQRASDPDDLRVKFGTLYRVKAVRGAGIPAGATIPEDARGYPAKVRPFLQADEYITCDHPAIVEKANAIRMTLPAEARHDTARVVGAVYEWESKHIEHESVLASGGRRRGGSNPFEDVTSGIWQTISGEGWSWGKSFVDWCWKPHELLELESGICVERAWLAVSILRALNVPARAMSGGSEFWAKTKDGERNWVAFRGRGGRTTYRRSGRLEGTIVGGKRGYSFSTLSRPILHEDWNAENKGLWRERHPWRERYQYSEAGYEQAAGDLRTFAETGEARRMRQQRRRGGRLDWQTAQNMEQGRLRPEPRHGCYEIHYSDVTVNLLTMGEQRELDVRFPLANETLCHEATGENAHWTNHPECVTGTRIDEIKNPPAIGTERWYTVEFDLTGLLTGK